MFSQIGIVSQTIKEAIALNIKCDRLTEYKKLQAKIFALLKKNTSLYALFCKLTQLFTDRTELIFFQFSTEF